ncbi:MAG: HIT family protein [Burkholderiales bacterium]
MRGKGKKPGETSSPLTPHPSPACELCSQPGGTLLYRNRSLRIVLVDDADYPGFCRVIWNAHVREMTDLAPAARARLMRAVFATEAAVRTVYRPHKINLASLGNAVAHLHWHVIPRHPDDAHFPQPVWAARQRRSVRRPAAQARARAARLAAALAHAVK